MLRNIHFFNLKPGADKERILHLMDHDLAEYARSMGCIERKTWRLLDARSGGEPTTAADYMNEALWPDQETADAFGQAARSEAVKQLFDEILAKIEVEKTIRYVDDEG
jgi:hypothetical protein